MTFAKAGSLQSALNGKSQILERVDLCRDEKDNKFLEVAINGKADYLITGDNDLLVLRPFQDVKIMTVNEFLGEK